MAEKTITIRITEDQHREIKVEAARQGVSVKDYILELVRKDLEEKSKATGSLASINPVAL